MKTLSTLLFALVCCFATLELSAQTATTAETTLAAATATRSFKVKVKGVGCSNDLATLAKQVEALDGVAKCTPLKHGAITTFEIQHDPAVATAEKIHAAIENTAGCTAPDSRPYKVKL